MSSKGPKRTVHSSKSVKKHYPVRDSTTGRFVDIKTYRNLTSEIVRKRGKDSKRGIRTNNTGPRRK